MVEYDTTTPYPRPFVTEKTIALASFTNFSRPGQRHEMKVVFDERGVTSNLNVDELMVGKK